MTIDHGPWTIPFRELLSCYRGRTSSGQRERERERERERQTDREREEITVEHRHNSPTVVDRSPLHLRHLKAFLDLRF